MSFSFLRRLNSTRRFEGADAAVSRDADELIRRWGPSAFEKATDLSWQEDSGLVRSADAGHWWRVRREVARRLGTTAQEPTANFAA